MEEKGGVLTTASGLTSGCGWCGHDSHWSRVEQGNKLRTDSLEHAGKGPPPASGALVNASGVTAKTHRMENRFHTGNLESFNYHESTIRRNYYLKILPLSVWRTKKESQYSRHGPPSKSFIKCYSFFTIRFHLRSLESIFPIWSWSSSFQLQPWSLTLTISCGLFCTGSNLVWIIGFNLHKGVWPKYLYSCHYENNNMEA